MTPALDVLRLTLRNRSLRAVGRLRKPQYWIPVLFALLYFVALAYSSVAWGDEFSIAEGLSSVVAVLPPVLALVVAWWWLLGGGEGALAFTAAEVQFLFTAPVSRRDLLVYRLAKTQPFVLESAAVLAVFVGGGLPYPLRLAGLWAAITTLHLHQVAATLVRMGALSGGAGGLRRSLLPLGIFVAMAGLLLWSLIPVVPELIAPGTLEETFVRLERHLAEPLPFVLLLPFNLVIAPLVADGAGGWATGMLGVLLLATLHYVWVTRADAALQGIVAEAGLSPLAQAPAVGAASPITRGGDPRRPWFPLVDGGHPAAAIAWKNVLAFTRSLRLSWAVAIAGCYGFLISILTLASGSLERAATVTFIAWIPLVVLTMAAGPLEVRYDLRGDLGKLEVLRALPVGGSALMAAELAGSTIALTMMQLGLLLLGACAIPFSDLWEPAGWWILLGVGASPLILAPLNAMCVGSYNALALLMPRWATVGTSHRTGVEVTGHQILASLVSAMALVTALVPPLMVGGSAVWRMWPVLDSWAVIPGALGAWVVLLGEVALMVMVLGELFDDLDVVEAGLVR